MKKKFDYQYHYDKSYKVKSFDDAEIWYSITGDGEKTIFLADGIACMGYVWKYIVEYFKDRYKIIHFNYRGHGKTPTPKSYCSITVMNMAKDMKAIMDDIGIDRATFIGHSMGVQTIFEFYKLFPDYVESLVPICGSYEYPLKYYHNTDKIEPIFKFFINYFLKPHPKIIKTLRKIVTNPFVFWGVSKTEINGKMLKKDDFLPYLYDIRDKLDLKAFAFLLESAMKHSVKSILHKIDIPVLIIAGEKDKMTPAALSRTMDKLLPDSSLYVVPWGSHTAPIEQPEMVNLLVDDFLVEKVYKN